MNRLSLLIGAMAAATWVTIPWQLRPRASPSNTIITPVRVTRRGVAYHNYITPGPPLSDM